MSYSANGSLRFAMHRLLWHSFSYTISGCTKKKSSEYENSRASHHKPDVVASETYEDLNPTTREKPETTPYESLDLHQYDNLACRDGTWQCRALRLLNCVSKLSHRPRNFSTTNVTDGMSNSLHAWMRWRHWREVNMRSNRSRQQKLLTESAWILLSWQSWLK